MGCGNCPDPTPALRRTPAGVDRLTRVTDPVEVLAAGTVVQPLGEPDLLIRVAAERIRTGVPPVVILTGPGHQQGYAAGAVRILGPATLGPEARTDFSIALRTRAAVEIL